MITSLAFSERCSDLVKTRPLEEPAMILKCKIHFKVEKLHCVALMLHKSLRQRIEFGPLTIISPPCVRWHQSNGLLVDQASPRLFLHSESFWFGFFFFFRGSRGEIGIGEVSSVRFSHSVQRSPERSALLILKDELTEGMVAPSFRKDEERINNSSFLPAPSLSISLLPSSVLTDFFVFIPPAL